MDILIWGTGGLASELVRRKYFEDATIIGFVDTYKKREQHMGLPVYYPKDIEKLCYDAVIVCVLKNNDEILATWREVEYPEEKLFFLHTVEMLNGVNEENYRQKVRQIKKNFPLVYKEIQSRIDQYLFINQTTKELEWGLDYSLIRLEGSHYVVAWVPIELLYTESRQSVINIDPTPEWEKHHASTENTPLIGFKPHRTLYNFFSNGSELPREYCEWYQKLFTTRGKKSGYSDESLVEKRYREYSMMRSELQKNGMEFFMQHPAVGAWNENGFFNLLDGHHRSSFLYNAGYRYIPVQITKEDYKKWCNRDQAEKVHQAILKQQRSEFYQPILNPYFLALQPHREAVFKSRLHMIMEYFNNTRFENQKVIDIGANLGYFGMHFARMGACVDLIEPDPLHYELATEIIRLMNVKNTKIYQSTFEQFSNYENYDIAIMLTVFYPYMSNNSVRMKFIDRLNQCVKTCIIWESGDEIENEKSYIKNNTKFKQYVHLGYTYGTRKFRELGIFYSQDVR